MSQWYVTPSLICFWFLTLMFAFPVYLVKFCTRRYCRKIERLAALASYLVLLGALGHV